MTSPAPNSAGAAVPAPLLVPRELRCEYRREPAGIDVPRPRLTWLLDSESPQARGQTQSAYQVLVSSSAALLDADRGDLWDSGKVRSDQTVQIEYAGRPLRSRRECWWKVRVWNGADQASGWSETARWTMGLLDSGDWQAHWIGCDATPPWPADPAPEDAIDLEGCRWIGARRNPVPTELVFRGQPDIGEGRGISRALLLLAGSTRFELYVNGKSCGCGFEHARAYVYEIAGYLRSGPNTILARVRAEPGTGAALIGRLRIERDDGSSSTFDLDRSWFVIDGEHAPTHAVSPDFQGWHPAEELGRPEECHFPIPRKQSLKLPPPVYLRKSFRAPGAVARATLFASALGLYELSINGRRVGDDLFTPGWTDYRKRVYYQTYDVTELLRQQGENVIGAILADGWYAGYVGFQGRRDFYGSRPRLLAQLHIEYDDGSEQIVVSDSSWRAGHGPLIAADMFMGCTYDARREIAGWDQPGFDDASWQPVAADSGRGPCLCAHPAEPVQRTDLLPARSISEPQPGVYIFDFGQNMVGFVRLKARADAGQRITLRHAEMLDPATGSIYVTSLRNARSTDTYIARGAGQEIWEPKFTYHGFRYVEVTGLSRRPAMEDLLGVAVHSPLDRTGWFECSSPLVNRLVQNIIWSQKGNYFEVPTDCPQRDERLGWTGDAQFFIGTGTCNFDVAAFFTKWLVDLQDAQTPEGAFPAVAPDVLEGLGAGNTGWADAGIVCPYLIYRMYADRRIIERHYHAMARYLAFLQSTSSNLTRDGGAYGDWLNLGGGADNRVVGTAYFAYVTRLMSEMAGAIGRSNDAQRYADLASSIREAFIREFVAEDGRIANSSQTGYALAFAMDLLPEPLRPQAARHFVEEIRGKDWHLATGFIGTPLLLPALTAAGRSDVAYRLLLTETYPSWLFPVKMGATTIWERWDGWIPDQGFQDPVMNSFNHYAFGSVGEWLYRAVAGINPQTPGFGRIRIAPRPASQGELTYARCAYRSIRGRIESGWALEDGLLTMTVTVPPNTTALVEVPTAHPASLREGGKPVSAAEGVKLLKRRSSAVELEVASGSYVFTCEL